MPHLNKVVHSFPCHLLLAVILLVPLLMSGQHSTVKPRIKWGLEQKRNPDVSLETVLKVKDEYILLLKSKEKGGLKKELIVEKIDKRLRPLSSTAFELDYYGEPLHFIKSFTDGSKVRLFSSHYHRSEERATLIFQTLNLTDMVLENDQDEWAEISIGEEDFEETGGFEISSSPSSECFLVKSLPDNGQNEFWVYNERFQQVHSIRPDDLKFTMGLVSDQSELVILSSDLGQMKHFSKDDPVLTDVSLSKFEALDGRLHWMDNGHILYCGSFGTASSMKVRGLFTSVYDPSSARVIYEDMEFIEDDHITLKELRIKSICSKRLGGSYLILEERDQKTGKERKKMVTTHQFGSLWIAGISPRRGN